MRIESLSLTAPETNRRIIAPALACLALSAAVILCGHISARAARWHGTFIKVGVLQEPKSINPWLAGDSWSVRVLRLLYQPLFVHHPKTLKMVPWLAAEYCRFDKATKSYTLKLRAAKWSDGTPFTSADVVFTVELIKWFKIPRYSSLWRPVKKVEALGPHQVRFVMKNLRPNFLNRTLTTPIVQKKQWAPIAQAAKKSKQPLRRLLQAKMDNPAVTGPFFVKTRRPGAFLLLARNKHFFGTGKTIAGWKLGPYVQGIILKVFGTSDAAVLALKKGALDFYWNTLQPGYLRDIRVHKAIKLYTSQKSGLYFIGFNVRKPPFNSTVFRRAVAMLIDKKFIFRRILQGSGRPLLSPVPPGNVMFHTSDVDRHGQGLTRAQRIKRAYQMLKKAGYTWQRPPVTPQGKIVRGRGIKLPGGKRMAGFVILTPPADYDAQRAMAGVMIQEWLKRVGIPAVARPMAFGALIQQIKVKRRFDAFVLGYGNLPLDPGYMWAFFHSSMDRPRGWNMSGYRNKKYDKLAVESRRTMDPKRRRELVIELQKIIMRDVPYFPLYNPVLIEGIRLDRFKGWVKMVGGIGNLWSFCVIKPVKRAR